MSEEQNQTVNGSDHALEQVGAPTFLEVPEFTASNFTTLGRSDMLTLLCGNPAVATDEKGSVGMAQKPRVALNIAPVDVKELIVLLQRYVATVEADRGPLTSDFLRANGIS